MPSASAEVGRGPAAYCLTGDDSCAPVLAMHRAMHDPASLDAPPSCRSSHIRSSTPTLETARARSGLAGS